MHPFRTYIAQYTTISDQEWEQIANVLTKKSYPKGVTLLKTGEVCKKLYFVEHGLLRFYLLKNGVDVTKFFTVAPYCFTSQRSFTDAVPGKDTIETLEHSKIWEMSKTDAFGLLELPAWSEFVRKLIQEVQFNTESILESIQNETAEERYQKMLEQHDPILSRVSSRHIASFLGIQPQSLSRIRKKIRFQHRS
ncbi:MAG: Crp/Fnr family transcriptional regulator [Bacteroidota bacterium]